MSDLTDKRIFDSIEDINKTFGVDLELPKKVPEGANIICYNIVDLYRVELFMYFKETLHELLGYTGGKWVASESVSIEEEIKWDSESGNNCYIYLNLTQKEVKDKFNPTCLLGVQTNKGFITAIRSFDWNDEGFVFDLDGDGTYQPTAFKYYISDDNDETVTFDEYVKLFYDVEGVL